MKKATVNSRQVIDMQMVTPVQEVVIETATEAPTPTWAEAAVCFENERDEGVWVAEIGASVQFVRRRFCTDDATIIAALRDKAAIGIREV